MYYNNSSSFYVFFSDCRIKRHRRCPFEGKNAFGGKHFTSSYRRFGAQSRLFLISKLQLAGKEYE